MIVYFNGKLNSFEQATLNLNDRGILLGDGVFETMRAYQGNVFFLHEHWQRLTNGLRFLRIPVPISFTEFTAAIAKTLKENALLDQHATLRFTVSRGKGPRGLAPPLQVEPTYFLTASPIITPPPDKISVIISKIRRNEFSPLSHIKSLNYLDNVLAKMEAIKKQVDEALLLNTRGNLAAASAANVFVVLDHTIYTPPLGDGVLPGITRQTILNICKQHRMAFQERSISPLTLSHASEIFISNSLIGIQSVQQLENCKLPSENPIAQKLKSEYQKIVHAQKKV